MNRITKQTNEHLASSEAKKKKTNGKWKQRKRIRKRITPFGTSCAVMFTVKSMAHVFVFQLCKCKKEVLNMVKLHHLTTGSDFIQVICFFK